MDVKIVPSISGTVPVSARLGRRLSPCARRLANVVIFPSEAFLEDVAPLGKSSNTLVTHIPSKQSTGYTLKNPYGRFFEQATPRSSHVTPYGI